MTLRDWVRKTLTTNTEQPVKNVVTIDPVGPNGLHVSRTDLPASRIFVAPAEGCDFTPHSLSAAVDEMPDLEFVLAVRRKIANTTYTAVDDRGVAIGGLYHLREALRTEARISEFRTRDRAHIEKRLRTSRFTAGIVRRGKDAYEIACRSANLRVTALMTNKYEFTAEELYNLIAQYSELEIEAVVVTNPNCYGFSSASKRAARETGTQLILLGDFLALDGPLG